jgi:hypothetical protein
VELTSTPPPLYLLTERAGKTYHSCQVNEMCCLSACFFIYGIGDRISTEIDEFIVNTLELLQFNLNGAQINEKKFVQKDLIMS